MLQTKLLIEPHYFGNISFYKLIKQYDGIVWEVSDHFLKQTFRNRNVILTANGPLSLVVPVKYGNRTPYKSVSVDYSENWQKKHLRAIQSAYAKSPFFDYYISEIETGPLKNRIW
ncbi:MAG: WbqC family protein [Bacteroidota bacterium]